MKKIDRIIKFYKVHPLMVLWAPLSFFAVILGIYNIFTGRIIYGIVMVCLQIPWIQMLMKDYKKVIK